MEYVIGALVATAVCVILYVAKVVVADWVKKIKLRKGLEGTVQAVFNASHFSFIFSVLGIGLGCYMLLSTGMWLQDSTSKVADILFRLAMWNGSIAGFVYFLNTRKVDVEEILCSEPLGLGIAVSGYFIGSALLLTLGF